MISPLFFYRELEKNGVRFFAGVPDSLLKDFCACITDTADKKNHIIAANEGAATALAAGFHLATGDIPRVYMQNSGLGNAVNPLLSLADPDVYSIPVILVIGWRGEPGVADEPQHKKQGKVTPALLDAMGIPYTVLAQTEAEAADQAAHGLAYARSEKAPYAFLVQKGTFEPYTLRKKIETPFEMTREQAIAAVIRSAPSDAVFVSTTGMASRELYELRDRSGDSHRRDFLTVGSMGHASQIAAEIALRKPERSVYCIDGDGALIMHMGSLTTIGTEKPENFRHIVINNGAHDSVGGQPTAGLRTDIPVIALAAGYASASSAETEQQLDRTLRNMPRGPVLIEIRVRTGARKDLGRPRTSPVENKQAFMEYLQGN